MAGSTEVLRGLKSTLRASYGIGGVFHELSGVHFAGVPGGGAFVYVALY
jgi:hypothetical protein